MPDQGPMDEPALRERLYSTSQLAEAEGVTTRTVRFYESRGLLKPQLAGTVRVYNYRDRARLALILRGKRLGFSLDEVAEYLALYDADPLHVEQMRHVRRKARERIAALRQQLTDLEETIDELEAIADEAAARLQSLTTDVRTETAPSTPSKANERTH